MLVLLLEAQLFKATSRALVLQTSLGECVYAEWPVDGVNCATVFAASVGQASTACTILGLAAFTSQAIST